MKIYKKTATLAVLVSAGLILVLGLFFYLETRTSAEVTVSVQSNQTIQSPLTIEGKAKGNWFFEAVFPAIIFDGSGRELGRGQMRAEGDWMTENFVPFSGTIDFSPSLTATGTLVLRNDNPSGLPEKEKKVEIPVRFVPAETQSVEVFFNNSRMDPEFSCNKVFAVTRVVPRTSAVGRAALEALLAGPTEAEKEQGFFTSLNPGVKIQSLGIENGVAKVDFDEALEKAVGGSCRVSAIRAEIMETLKQFPTVKSVLISIDGRTEDILQP